MIISRSGRLLPLFQFRSKKANVVVCLGWDARRFVWHLGRRTGPANGLYLFWRNLDIACLVVHRIFSLGLVMAIPTGEQPADHRQLIKSRGQLKE